MSFSAQEMVEKTRKIVAPWKEKKGGLIPILQEIQKELGYISSEAMETISKDLKIPKSEIYGVVTFYHDFRKAPAGRHVLKLCQAEACQSMGSDRIAARVKQLLGIDFHETTGDGAVTLEPVYCLGLCACSPSAMLDGEVFGRLDDDRIEDIMAELRS